MAAKSGEKSDGFPDTPKQEARDPGVLVVYGTDHPLMQALYRDEVLEAVNQRLRMAESGLTARDLVLDLGSYFTTNPDIATRADATSCYNLLLMAGAYGCSFGDGGIWPLPDGKTLRGQVSEKLLTRRAQEGGKCTIQVVMVFEGQDVTVDRGDDGAIVGVRVDDPADPFSIKRVEETLRGGFGIAHFEDGTKRIEMFDRDDLERRKNHSAAVQKALEDDGRMPPMWRNDPIQGHERGIRAAMARYINPIPTHVAGRGGDMLALSGPGQTAQIVHDDAAEPITIANVADDLKGREEKAQAEEEPKAEKKPTDSLPLTLEAAQPDISDLPPQIQELVNAKELNAVQLAYRGFSQAWGALAEMPDSLAIIYRENGPAWAGRIGKEEQSQLQMLAEIKKLFWDRATQAGKPQA